MKKYYQKKNITLYNDDCINIMQKMDDKSVDMIIADYPFNCQDGRNEYEKFIQETALLFEKKAKDVCNLVVINSPAKIFTTVPFFQNWTLINGVALIRKGSLRPAWHFGFQHNYMLILNKGGIKNKWNGTKKNHDKTFDTDVMPYQNGYRGKGNVWHPQAIPLDMTTKLIKYLSHEQDTILDPFAGSGTTLVAASMLNRKAIGIEYHQKYCDIVVQRLDSIQLNLLDEKNC